MVGVNDAANVGEDLPNTLEMATYPTVYEPWRYLSVFAFAITDNGRDSLSVASGIEVYLRAGFGVQIGGPMNHDCFVEDELGFVSDASRH